MFRFTNIIRHGKRILLTQRSSSPYVHKSSIHKLSRDKQRNLISVHHETKHHLRKHKKNSPFYAEYNACETPNQILSLLTKYEDAEDIISHHIWAIQRLTVLNEFKLCWTIFSDLTTSPRTIPLLTTQLYNTMMWVSIQHHLSQPDKIRNDKLRRKKTCDKIFSLLSALKNKVNLQIDCDTITTVISSCCKLQQFGRGEGFWKLVTSTNSDESDDGMNRIGAVELNIDAFNAMLDLYSKSDQMNEAYDLWEGLMTDGNVKCNHLTFAILINGCHKHGDLKTAQKIFDESKEYLISSNDSNESEIDSNPSIPNKDVYCALMNGYAARGDVLKCWELFTEILMNHQKYINTEEEREYAPDLMVFSLVLKSLSRLNNNEKLKKRRDRRNRIKALKAGQSGKFMEISVNGDAEAIDQAKLGVDDCWKMIKYIILKMKEMDIKRNEVIYGLLFHLCGDAFGEENCKWNVAQKFYEQMVSDQVEMSSLCFHNLLKVGLCHYNTVEKDHDGKVQFVKWILTEMKKNNVPVSSQMRVTLRRENIDVVDYGPLLSNKIETKIAKPT